MVNVAPIPEMDALFPIIGFFAVAFAMQRLRRRRAQQVSTMWFGPSRAGITEHCVFGAGDIDYRFSFFIELNGAVLQTIPRRA